MTWRQTQAEIMQLRRTLEDQARLLEEFMKKSRDNITLVRSELSGSPEDRDTAILAALQQTESSMTKAITALNRASDALLRVEGR